MSSIIHHHRDDQGEILITQKGHCRFLEFGEDVEQSCVDMQCPERLMYQYARAMLLGGLNHPQPKSALFMGMGGGALIQACNHCLNLEDIVVMEIRRELPVIARQYLGFDPQNHIQILIGDAKVLIKDMRHFDLIFMDLYTELGPDALHIEPQFLKACRQLLNPEGWLVINQWETDNGKPLGAALLRGTFDKVYWECPVDEGNVILWIPQSHKVSLNIKALSDRVERLDQNFGYNLANLMRVIRPAS